MDTIYTDSLLDDTRSLISKMINFRKGYGLTPKNSDVGTAVGFSEISISGSGAFYCIKTIATSKKLVNK